MRIAAISDIHANLPALEAVIADARSQGAKRFAVLGDLVDRGPFPQETLDLLRSVGTWFITGNTDLGVVRMASEDVPPAWRSASQFAPIRWTANQLGQEALAFLASLPKTLVVTPDGCESLRLVHGTRRSPSEGLYPKRNEMDVLAALEAVPERVFLCGHTHQQWLFETPERVAINPGSVGISFGAGGRAQYALLTWDSSLRSWQTDLRSVAYDRERTLEAFRDCGFLDQAGHFGRAAFSSVVTGEDVMGLFLQHLEGVLERRGTSSVSDEAWEEAGATFEWVAGVEV